MGPFARILAIEIPLYRPSPISTLNNVFSQISYSTNFIDIPDSVTSYLSRARVGPETDTVGTVLAGFWLGSGWVLSGFWDV